MQDVGACRVPHVYVCGWMVDLFMWLSRSWLHIVTFAISILWPNLWKCHFLCDIAQVRFLNECLEVGVRQRAESSLSSPLHILLASCLLCWNPILSGTFTNFTLAITQTGRCPTVPEYSRHLHASQNVMSQHAKKKKSLITTLYSLQFPGCGNLDVDL